MKVRGLPIYFGVYACAYEIQVWRLWIGVYQPRYMRTSGLGFIRWYKGSCK